MPVIRLKNPRTTALVKIEAQRDIVRKAYSLTNSVNPTYEQEFNKLSDMVNDFQIAQYQKEHDVIKTPYDNNLRRFGNV